MRSLTCLVRRGLLRYSFHTTALSFQSRGVETTAQEKASPVVKPIDASRSSDEHLTRQSNPEAPTPPPLSGNSPFLLSSWLTWDAVKFGCVLFIVSSCWDFFNSRRELMLKWIEEMFYTKLEVRTNQVEFEELMYWLSLQDVSQRTANLTVMSSGRTATKDEDIEKTAAFPSSGPRFVPGLGVHCVSVLVPRIGHVKVWVYREIDESKKHKPSSSPSFSSVALASDFFGGGRVGGDRQDEILRLVCFGSSGREVLEHILQDSQRCVEAHKCRFLRIFVNDNGYWEPLCIRAKRPLDTLTLNDEALRVVDEVKTFFSSESRKMFQRLGIPWRRGYLLCGPPGTGKSSFIGALAGIQHAPLYLLSLRDPSLTDAGLMKAVNSVPRHSFLVLEDLDTVFSRAPASSAADSNEWCYQSNGRNVTISGILNALDGIGSSDGRVLFVTANDVEQLPKPLLRPGRLDRCVAFHRLDKDDVLKMSASFMERSGLAKYSPSDSRDFDSLRDARNQVSPAEVQNVLLEKLVFAREGL